MTTSRDDILAGLLAECSDSILAGATVKACLDRHPQHAAALEPLLTTLVDVHELRAVPVRPVAAAARTREQFMAAATLLSEQREAAPVSWWKSLPAWWAGILALIAPPAGGRASGAPVGLFAAVLIVILVGVLVTGGVTASAKALPGDLLYPIKITGERVQLFMARDPVTRSFLEQEFSGRRRQEAKAVVEQGRRADSLPLDGMLEAINDNHWTVSGLDLTLDPAAQIIGMPTVGARVHCVLRAPGDGRLIVIYAVVDALAADTAPALAVTPPTATSTRPRVTATATATATPTATPEDTATSTAAAPNLLIQDRPEPDDRTPAVRAAKSATPTRARTAAPRPRPTATPAPTLAPVPTDMPSPRTQTTLRIVGWVERIEGDRWIIDGIPVKVTGATQIVNNATVGWNVEAAVILDADGYYTALQITGLAPPEATPEPVELTDILYNMSGEWWTIGATSVRVTGDTAIEGNPQIGDLVSMQGERHQAEIWALRIVAIRLTEVQFEGIISAVSGSSLVIDGYTVEINGQTQVIGTPEVGRVAQVSAVQRPDGRLIGKMILVLDPAPTPTMTATPTPTATATAEPTPTPTLEATSTATAEPTPTMTPEPTSTATAEPTSTTTAEPTSTATAEPPAPASLEATASPRGAVELCYAKAGV